MGNKPNSGDDYVVIVVRLPIKLLTRLGRWLVLAAGTYVLLHHQPKAGRESESPSCLGL
jgi:hypothetical protein